MSAMNIVCRFFFSSHVGHRYLHLLTHSFPTRRSSDLKASLAQPGCQRPVPIAVAGIVSAVGATHSLGDNELAAVEIGHQRAGDAEAQERLDTLLDQLARQRGGAHTAGAGADDTDRKSTRLNSSH